MFVKEIPDRKTTTTTTTTKVRFKNSMLRSSLCNYSDAYILVKGTITGRNTAAQGQTNNTTNKEVIVKNCALYPNCISRINNTQVDDAYDIDVVTLMYNLIECCDNYSKTSMAILQTCTSYSS